MIGFTVGSAVGILFGILLSFCTVLIILILKNKNKGA